MQFVDPEVYHIAATAIDAKGVDSFFAGYEVEDWVSDAPSDPEKVIEIAGRRCYNSFATENHPAGEKNPNISRVREGNKEYIGNILRVNHGSVLEHCSDTYMLHNVSRVLTHELVRHRVGTAFSQESLRFVRLMDVGMWFPHCFNDLGYLKYSKVVDIFKLVMKTCEDAYKQIGEIIEIDEMKSFAKKKKFTSAMRRIMPIGLGTGICVTANHRTWRHTIEMRTSRHAEEELRLVFGKIAYDLRSRYENLYQDMQEEYIDGFMEYTFPRD